MSAETELREAIRQAFTFGQSPATVDRMVDQEWVRHEANPANWEACCTCGETMRGDCCFNEKCPECDWTDEAEPTPGVVCIDVTDMLRGDA